MKFNLKYLVLTVLAPLCVSAGDQGDQLPEGNTVTLRSGAYTAAEEKSHVAGASVKDETSPETNVSTDLRLLTFKEARHEWCLGGDKGRDIARPTFYSLIQNKEASYRCFGASQKLLIARLLLLSDNEADQKVAKNYCKVVLLNEEHEDYEGLIELTENNESIENKLKLIGLIAQ